jgi:glycosyltransferase involved in cell wall biosynthesis
MEKALLRVLFLGFALPDEAFTRLLECDAGMPIQTQRFGWSVIEAMTSADISVSIVSAAPATDYPHNSHLFFRGFNFTDHGVAGTTISFVNVTGLKHATRYATARRVSRRTASRAQPDAVVIHGVHSPFLWCGIHLGRKYGVPVIVILTDPPSQRSQHDSASSRSLKRVDRDLIRGALKRVDGVIALTEDLATDFAPTVPYLLMEGIAKPLQAIPRLGVGRALTPKRVVYAGGLHEAYGVSELLASVCSSEGDWQLWFYGRGPLEAAITAKAASSPRVKFGGLADAAQLATAYADADLLVNPRSASADFTRHSFPSKLLEYLASGRPVLSTRLSGIPLEYEPYLYWTEGDSASLSDSIDSILSLPQKSLNAKATAGREFILSSRSSAAQGRRIREFIVSMRF